jgi:hypothetical protein
MAKAKTRSHDEIKSFVEEFKNQTDRGAAIVASAVLDDALTHAIQSRLVPLSNRQIESLFGRMRPLSSFSAKIELGAAIGLYDQNLRRTLNMIRDVRNEFAHQMGPITFADRGIAQLVRNARPPPLPKDTPTREIFNMGFFAAYLLLRGVAASAQKIRLKQIGHTHPEIFLTLAAAAQTYYAQVTAKADDQPNTATDTPPQRP